MNAPKIDGKKKQKTWPDSNLHTHLDSWCLAAWFFDDAAAALNLVLPFLAVLTASVQLVPRL